MFRPLLCPGIAGISEGRVLLAMQHRRHPGDVGYVGRTACAHLLLVFGRGRGNDDPCLDDRSLGFRRGRFYYAASLLPAGVQKFESIRILIDFLREEGTDIDPITRDSETA
jgi:hypothetical protein